MIFYRDRNITPRNSSLTRGDNLYSHIYKSFLVSERSLSKYSDVAGLTSESDNVFAFFVHFAESLCRKTARNGKAERFISVLRAARYGTEKPAFCGECILGAVKSRGERRLDDCRFSVFTEYNSDNIVGFQTNLKFPEQKRVFGIIPALKNAEFLRYGVMHRNTFINAPEVIDANFRVKAYPKTYVAGQLSGVEGYVESIMSGLIAARSIFRDLNGLEPVTLPRETICGALCAYLDTPNAAFQPMNANFGLLPPITEKIKDKNLKKTMQSEKSLKILKNFTL